MRRFVSSVFARVTTSLWVLSVWVMPALSRGPNGNASDVTHHAHRMSRAVFSTGFEPVFDHLTVDDGLPDNSVRAITQDRFGFLWFGTQNGLVRYDGYKLTVFVPSLDDSTAFGGRTVQVLYQDRERDLWIGTFLNGLWHFDLDTETFAGYSFSRDERPGAGGGRINGVCEDRYGRLWVSTLSGLATLDLDTRQITWHELEFPGGPKRDIFSYAPLLADKDGNVWVGTQGGGVAMLDPGTMTPHFLRDSSSDSGALINPTVNDILQASDGSIWFATEEGLSRWLPGADSFVSYSPIPGGGNVPENRIQRIAEDETGLLWLGVVAGVCVFDPATGQFRVFEHDSRKPFSPASGPVLSVFCDRTGVVWTGSWYTALNKMDPRSGGFTIHRHDPDDPGSIAYSAVLALHEDTTGDLWVGSGTHARGGARGGLSIRRRPESVFRQVPYDREARKGRVTGAVTALHRGSDGTLWVGAQLGLWRVDGDRLIGDRLIPAKTVDSPESTVLGNSLVRSLVSDMAGNLWIGTSNNGLFRLHVRTGELRQFLHDPADSTSISYSAIIELHLDRRGRLWIGTDAAGLDLYLPESGRFRRFFDPRIGLDSVIDIHETEAGDLWLGTFAGLLRFDPEVSRVTATYGLREGLPNEQVVSILEDDGGDYWLSTGNGIARLNLTDGSVKSFDRKDGLPGSEAHFGHFKGRDGSLYFGGPYGLVTIHPGRLEKNEQLPPVVLTGIYVSDELLEPGDDSPLSGPVHLVDQIALDHDQNDISISFAALDFGRPERNKYRYLLEGFDKHWRDPGQTRTATYTNLAPGNYQFRVQGSNRDGVWNETGAVVNIRIHPPWWRTYWAYTLYGLILAAIGFAIYRQIVHRERMNAALAVEKAEAQHLHDLDRMKSTFLANISHEFRTPLTLIRAPLNRLLEDPAGGDKNLFAKMFRNARRLSELIEQLLDLSRLEAGRLPVTWQRSDYLGYFRALVSAFDWLVEERGITLITRIPEGTSEAWYDPDLLEKVVGNLLSNACKFTPEGGEVTIEVMTAPETTEVRVPRSIGPKDAVLHKEARELTVAVTNTGSYIPPEQRQRIFDRFHQFTSTGGSGLGLALVKELVEWMGGQITVDSGPEKWTRFTVHLPIFLAPPADELTADEESSVLDVEPVGREAAIDEGSGAETQPEAEEPPLVLVVEDHPDLRTYLRDELQPEFVVTEATDGITGFDKAVMEIPDLVLSDVMMPKMDGFELCERLKNDDRTSHVPVILLTARTERESRHRGLLGGADDYLAKPFDIEDLRIRVRNLIVQRRKLAEQFAKLVITPDALPVSSADERFVLNAREVIETHLEDPGFKISAFCREMAMSRTQLHRKLKAVTNQSTTEFVRTYRLQRAAQLLEGGYGNVTEVAYAVGFRNLSYFSKCFRELYGVLPSDYRTKS